MGQESLLNTSIVMVGRVGAPYGVKGWAHIHSFTSPIDNILSYKTWYLKIASEWQLVEVKEAKVHPKGLVALFSAIEDRNAIAKWVNLDIGVPRTALPELEDGVYYWNDLINLQVYTEQGETLGLVKGLLETGSNDVLVVQGPTKEHLIPYIPSEYVLEVNIEGGFIRVIWDPEF